MLMLLNTDRDYNKLISYKGEIAEVKVQETGGETEYEFPLPVEWLEKMLIEIKQEVQKMTRDEANKILIEEGLQNFYFA